MALFLWLGSQLSFCWSNISILAVFLTVFTLIFDFMKRRKKWSQYPPGPVSLPFIGTMLCVDFKNPQISFSQPPFPDFCISSMGDSIVPPVTGDAHLAVEVAGGEVQGQWNIEMYKKGKTRLLRALFSVTDQQGSFKLPSQESLSSQMVCLSGGDLDPWQAAMLHKKYGNIFSLQNCWTNVVVLNGYKTVKEALVHQSEDFADRPYFPMYEHLGYGNGAEGIVFAKYGQVWKEQRKFALSTLRNFGMGKKSLEERVREEANFLCSAIDSEEGRPVDLRFLVNNAVCNMICSIVYGERFNYGDETFKKLLHLFESLINEEAGFLPQLLNEVPILLRIPGVEQKVFGGQKAFMDFIDILVEKHKETWSPAYIRDFTDAFLKEMEKGKAAEANGFTYQNLRLVTADLFSAGSETTATTLRWAILRIVLQPEVQSKIQAEIDKVIGRDRTPTMEDQASMPYTCAAIHEVQRHANIVPLGLPHMTYRDTTLQGFFIPKGTTIITNLSSVLKDEAVWEKPNDFYPEHFLDANGQFVKPEAFLPFSAGRRACPGEQLARMELFIFFTTLLQKFTFVLPEDQPRPREDGHFAFIMSPYPYQVRAIPR